MFTLINKILGDPNQRKVKKLEPIVDHINLLEAEFEKMTDDELRAKTAQFKAELANRERFDNPERDFKAEQEILDYLLPEAFATVREGARRSVGMRHYDTQLVGGMVLNKGNIAEMRTGEGKTLVATLPAYLNALAGKGVHVVTVNDYLAKRDAEWMGKIYEFLGLSVGLILSGNRQSFWEKRAAYHADITYGTNNEFGFDYLRDNMASAPNQLCQRPYYYAIVDEVDSILIDEARTPLIISGRLEQSAETYRTMSRIAPTLQPEVDYTIDEKARNIILTEDGIDHAQSLLQVNDLFDPKTNLAHYLLQALKAKELYRCDIEYVVKDNQVVIVDEFTGRLMEGRRWSDGLHQAVEAKEGVNIQDETQTLASITFQNLFRLYPKLSGMTGTAMTEEAEFGKIYNLEVTTIPTNRPDQRKDHPDVIYKTQAVKYFKAIEEIVENHLEGRPVLVGTVSIEQSENLSQMLTYPKAMTDHLRDKAKRLLESLGEKDQTEDLKKALKQPETVTAEQYEKLAQETKSADVADFLFSMAATATAIATIKKGIPHHVLNAKYHEQEALIVAQAGRKGAVTIATNMAGRGTDIVLGGNPEYLVKSYFAEKGQEAETIQKEAPTVYQQVLDEMKAITDAEKEVVLTSGGLHIIGTERHESRRIDNQLRGRSARQGDPGSTRFFLSLEDNLMKLFGGQRIAGLMEMLNVDETMPITAGMVSKAIEGAQRKVEAYHFDIRKNILQYDDVLTEQRKLIYGQRRQVLEGRDLRASMLYMIEEEMARIVEAHLTAEGGPEGGKEQWAEEDIQEMLTELHSMVPQLTHLDREAIRNKNFGQLIELFQAEAIQAYETMENDLTQMAEQLQADHGIQLIGLQDDVDDDHKPDWDKLSEAEKQERSHPLRQIEREIVLSVVDAKWIDYLHNLDHLREGIGLRAYGQKDPLIEYKREAFELFQGLTFEIQREAVALFFRSRIEIQLEQSVEQLLEQGNLVASNADMA